MSGTTIIAQISMSLMTNGSLMKVESIAECSPWSKVLQNAPLEAVCNTFVLHYGKIGLENQFSVFLRVAVSHRFYCIRPFRIK